MVWNGEWAYAGYQINSGMDIEVSCKLSRVLTVFSQFLRNLVASSYIMMGANAQRPTRYPPIQRNLKGIKVYVNAQSRSSLIISVCLLEELSPLSTQYPLEL